MRRGGEPDGRGGRGPAGVPGSRSVQSLAELRVGQAGEVVAVEAPDQAGFRRLFALGLVPGAWLKLIQRIPTYVFVVGRTTIAVDARMAAGIGVARDHGTQATDRGGASSDRG